MAVLTIQDALVTGLDSIAFVAADTLGDTVVTGAGIFLLIKNADTVAHTATVETPGTVRGLAIEDPGVTVPATTGLGVIPLIAQVFGAAANITYDTVTNLTVAAVRLAR